MLPMVGSKVVYNCAPPSLRQQFFCFAVKIQSVTYLTKAEIVIFNNSEEKINLQEQFFFIMVVVLL